MAQGQQTDGQQTPGQTAAPAVSGQLAPPPRRDPGPRDDGRDALPVQAREPHEKFHIPREWMKPGWDYTWAATKIRGMPNPRFVDRVQGQWQPVRAEEMPGISRLRLGAANQMLVEMGFIPEVKPDGPIVIDDQMLMMRPLAISNAAKERDRRAATEQVEGHLNAARAKSDRALGPGKSEARRTYGPADEAPSDRDVEMGI